MLDNGIEWRISLNRTDTKANTMVEVREIVNEKWMIGFGEEPEDVLSYHLSLLYRRIQRHLRKGKG